MANKGYRVGKRKSVSVPELRKLRRKLGITLPVQHRGVDIKRISKLRSKLELSQRQFADLLGVSVDSVQNWESGRRQPRDSRVIEVLNRLIN